MSGRQLIHPYDLGTGGADLSNRLIEWQTGGAPRWRLGIIDTQPEGTPDVGGDLKLQAVWNGGTTVDMLRVDRDLGQLFLSADNGAVTISDTLAPGLTGARWEINQDSLRGFGYGENYPRVEITNFGDGIYLRGQTASSSPRAQITVDASGNLLLYSAPAFIGGVSNAQVDLGGGTTQRWKKLWVQDIDISGTQTGGGAGSFLPLTGGTITGDLTISEATPSLYLKQPADTQPRVILTDGQLVFGPGGSTAPDVYLSRPAANALRTDANLGLAVNASVWQSSNRAVQVGAAGALYGHISVAQLYLSSNSYMDAASTNRALLTDEAARIGFLSDGSIRLETAASVTAGQPQAFVGRVHVDNVGSVGIGVAPAAWHSSIPALQMSARTALWESSSQTYLSNNTYLDTSVVSRAIAAAASTRLIVGSGSLAVHTAPSVAAGGSQGFTERLLINEPGNVGVGVSPEAGWSASWRALRIGFGGALWSYSVTGTTFLSNNSYYDGTNFRAIRNAPATAIMLEDGTGQIELRNAVAVGAAATQTYVPRLAVGPTGKVTITPDAGVAALRIGTTDQPKITVASAAPSSPMTGDLWMW